MIAVEFIILLLCVSFGGWLLSVGAEKLADRYGNNFAGSILLAVVTTLPEYLFVFWAARKGFYDMAVGSAVGACTLLVTLGYGSVILLSTTRMSRKPVKVVELSRNTQIDALYLAITAVVAFALAWEGHGLDLKDGIILTAIYLIYVAKHWHIARRVARQQREANAHSDGILRSVVMLIIGGLIILLVAERFVDSMLHIARAVGISPAAIAIVISPIASEMPEKITAYLTVMRSGKLAEISICNFIGSKVNHNSLLLAVLPFISTLHHTGNVPGIIGPPFIVMTALTIVATVSLARRRLERWQGWMFLGLYLCTIAAAYSVK